MIFELIFTSYPKGLRTGSSGFTSVAYTEGMPNNYIELCESLSGYQYLYPLRHPLYKRNPDIYSHYRFKIGKQDISILSKIVAFGKDYTGRENKLAHHIVLHDDDKARCGPAWAMLHGGLFTNSWDKDPCLLPKKRLQLPQDVKENYFAMQWAEIFDDAGGAGILAQAADKRPKTPSFIMFEPGMSLLPLMVESQLLLPPEKRWDITFSTYFHSKPIDSDCQWRGCLEGSISLKSYQQFPTALQIDLHQKTIKGDIPKNNELYDCARNGTMPSWGKKKEEPIPRPEEQGAFAKNGLKTDDDPFIEIEPSQSVSEVSYPKINENQTVIKPNKINFLICILLLCSSILLITFIFPNHKDDNLVNRTNPTDKPPSITDEDNNLVNRTNPTDKPPSITDEDDMKKNTNETINTNDPEYNTIDLEKPEPQQVSHIPTSGNNIPDDDTGNAQDNTGEEKKQTITFRFYDSNNKLTLDQKDLQSSELFECSLFYDNGEKKSCKIFKLIDEPGYGMEIDEKMIGQISVEKIHIDDPESKFNQKTYAAIHLVVNSKKSSELFWLKPLKITSEMIKPGEGLYCFNLDINSINSELISLLKQSISRNENENIKGNFSVKLTQRTIEVSMNCLSLDYDKNVINLKLSDVNIDMVEKEMEDIQSNLQDIDDEIKKIKKIKNKVGDNKDTPQQFLDTHQSFSDIFNKYSGLDDPNDFTLMDLFSKVEKNVQKERDRISQENNFFDLIKKGHINFQEPYPFETFKLFYENEIPAPCLFSL